MIVADTKYMYSRIVGYSLIPDEVVSSDTFFSVDTSYNSMLSVIDGNIAYLYRKIDNNMFWAAFDLDTKEFIWKTEIVNSYANGYSMYACHSDSDIIYVNVGITGGTQLLIKINKVDGTYTEVAVNLKISTNITTFTYYINSKIYVLVEQYTSDAGNTVYEPTMFIISVTDGSVISLPIGDNGGLFYSISLDWSDDGICAAARNATYNNGILYFIAKASVNGVDVDKYQIVALNTYDNSLRFIDIATPDYQDYDDWAYTLCLYPDCSKIVVGITNYLAVYYIENDTVEFIKLSSDRGNNTYVDRIMFLSDTKAVVLYYDGENVGIFDFSTNKFSISGEDWFSGESDIIVSNDTLIFRDGNYVVMYSMPLSSILWCSRTVILGNYGGALYYISVDGLVKSNEPLWMPALPQYANICKLPS